MKSSTNKQPQPQPPSRSSFKNTSLLQNALLASFALAILLLTYSHRALSSPANTTDILTTNTNAQRHQLQAVVPLPPTIERRQAAKGGLPPIPDFVLRKQRNEEQDENYMLLAAGNAERESNNNHIDANVAEGGVAAAANDIPTFHLPSEAVPAESVLPEVILEPTYGTHRPDQDAVFAFAEGYDLGVYVTFVESLKATGFTGDIVFAVSHIRGLKDGVADYLNYYSQQGEEEENSDHGSSSLSSSSSSPRVISYALEWECYKKSGARISPTNNEGRGSTVNHGFSDCKIHGLYSDGKDNTHTGAEDPRPTRPVATARYELYWIWSRRYREHSSILIVDARDAYFQSNPFAFVPPPSTKSGQQQPPKIVSYEQAILDDGSGSSISNSNSNHKECRLDLFEENYEAVNIAKSHYNSRWISTAYGKEALKLIRSKPVICSGSSMGSQKAMELYSRAMVAQFDKTKCKQVGCDQGFHNYLYYEGGLKPFLAAHQCTINVHRQGDGAVNNLAAMRNSSLRLQGVLVTSKANTKTNKIAADDGIVVMNNDKSTLSPVIHQFDRDDELKRVIRGRTSGLVNRWRSSRKGLHR